MAFIDERMPERITSGFVIAPRWKTLVVPMDNGGEQRNGEWIFPKMEARANMGIFTAADRAAIMNMQMACRGRLHCFRVRNPLNWQATNQPLYEIGGVMYLAKAYALGSETAYQPIHAPVTATLSGSGSVDMATGVVTGASITDTWSGTFDHWMRFDNDWNSVTAVTRDVWNFDIELIEVPRR